MWQAAGNKEKLNKNSKLFNNVPCTSSLHVTISTNTTSTNESTGKPAMLQFTSDDKETFALFYNWIHYKAWWRISINFVDITESWLGGTNIHRKNQNIVNINMRHNILHCTSHALSFYNAFNFESCVWTCITEQGRYHYFQLGLARKTECYCSNWDFYLKSILKNKQMLCFNWKSNIFLKKFLVKNNNRFYMLLWQEMTA